MSTEYTPTTDEVRATFAWQGVYTYGRQVEMQSEQFDRFLATVRPNPADPAMLALVRRAVADPGQFVPRGDDYNEPIPSWSARAVLAALATMGGER